MVTQHPHRTRTSSAWIPSLASLCLGLVTALSVVVAESDGQNALGRGDALDRNLSPTTGGRNLPRPGDDFRSRNLVITGNVVGGRGFRGSVGYAADRDFRDALGSDDLFDFRAQSAWSNPQVARSGLLSDQFRLGQNMGLLEYRRSAAGATPRTIGQAPGPSEDWWADQLRLERQRLDEMTVYSSMGRTLEMSTEPAPVGVTYSEEGDPFIINASPLRGISITSMQESALTQGLTTYDVARVREDVASRRDVGRVGRPFVFEFGQMIADPAAADRPAGADAERPGTGLDEEYVRILERIAERYAEANDTTLDMDRSLLNRLDETYGELREQLEALRVSRRPGLAEQLMQDAESPTGAAPTRQPRRSRDSALPGVTMPGEDPADDPPSSPRTLPEVIAPDAPRIVDPLRPETDDDEEDKDLGLGLDEIAFILSHDQNVERLSPAEQSRFNELMRLAEESLRAGDYFMAERRFLRALRFTPNHPMALLGVAHSQLGAGLYLSASLSVQRLLSEHPEMIDVAVSPELLPPRERLNETVQELQSRLNERRDRDAYGFLLAYIGHQIGDRSLIESGLSILRDAAEDDPLLPLLERIWLSEEDGESPAPRGDDAMPDANPESATGPETSAPEK